MDNIIDWKKKSIKTAKKIKVAHKRIFTYTLTKTLKLSNKTVLASHQKRNF